MVFGWDISTSVIGVSAFNESGIYLGSKFLDLRKVSGGLLEKADHSSIFVKNAIGSLEWTCRNSSHFIEDRLGNFSTGRTMLQTLMTLAAFNAVVSYQIQVESRNVHEETKLRHIHPVTVKSLLKPMGLVIPKGGDKKKITLEFVRRIYPSFDLPLNRNGKPQPYCYDMADSVIIAVAGMRKFR